VSPVITKCSLAAVMASSPSQSKTKSHIRPQHLPPPTTLPLRYCSHNRDSNPIDEINCLLSLLSPNAEAKKNKEHYILATADPEQPSDESVGGDGQQKRKSTLVSPTNIDSLRRGARSIPGVPIIYVKRSVMVLEPMSGSSEGVREGSERRKFKSGFVSAPLAGKRKRDADGSAPTKAKGARKAKGPNPLSAMKPRKRVKVVGENVKTGKDAAADATSAGKEEGDDDDVHIEPRESVGKARRKRRHKSHKSDRVEVRQADDTVAIDS
jgi:U3 small nucleolar RNA-associated protein 23